LVIHQHDIGMMTPESMDRFQAGTDDLNHLMLATAHHLRQRCADAFLVVRDQDAHGRIMAELPVPAEPI
jgi:hypothetical protein